MVAATDSVTDAVTAILVGEMRRVADLFRSTGLLRYRDACPASRLPQRRTSSAVAR